MRVVVYGAFERAAWSESARSHVACLARVLGAHIVVVGDCPRLERGYFWGVSYSPLAHDVEREVDMERLSRNPGQWVNAMREMLQAVEGEIVAVVAPHSPRALRLLSLYAASAGVVFWGNMMASGLPECTRVVCAHRVGEWVAPPRFPFCATLCREDVRDPHALVSSPEWAIAGDVRSACVRMAEPRLLSFEELTAGSVALDGARVVFAGGRGLGSRENFEKLERCAQRYGAAVAGTRLAVDLGWCHNARQVGQTGLSVSPDIYVAFGVSGAIQHLAGIRQAKCIVAINTDKKAPIFEHADIGVVADAVDVLEHMLK